jgi:hypothetical protein
MTVLVSGQCQLRATLIKRELGGWEVKKIGLFAVLFMQPNEHFSAL